MYIEKKKVQWVASEWCHDWFNHAWTCWFIIRIFGEKKNVRINSEWKVTWQQETNWWWNRNLFLLLDDALLNDSDDDSNAIKVKCHFELEAFAFNARTLTSSRRRLLVATNFNHFHTSFNWENFHVSRSVSSSSSDEFPFTSSTLTVWPENKLHHYITNDQWKRCRVPCKNDF